jgi:hypothetical protein
MSKNELDEIKSQIENLPQNGKMVEWGSGGSTVTWLSLLNKNTQLISIEHNWDWYEKIDNFVYQYLKDRIQCDFKYLYKPPLHQDYDHQYATILEEHPYGLDDYILPNEVNISDADIYFIDGVSRAAVASLMLLTSSNINAVYYIHDYKGREHWYDWLVSKLPYKTTIDTMLKFSKNKDLV